MIRKLTEQDHEQTYAFLKQEPSFNLFLIGDIEAFGYDQEFQELWGLFGEDDSLQAVLLRYHTSFIPYTVGEFDVTTFSKQLQNYDHVILSGKTKIVEQFENVEGIKLGNRRDMYFCECLNADYIKNEENKSVQLATLEDVDRIMELRAQIQEFRAAPQAKEMLKQAIETKTGRTYYIEIDGVIVSSASTAAENSQSAMVVGVCTHPDYRGHSYASLILEQIIRDITAEGKTLCLFYDNPAAGRIYKRLGFQDIGMWTMYR
ncbi:GNAT family N-acetyltransferase [Microbacteriaceae bacterium 4G12]